MLTEEKHGFQKAEEKKGRGRVRPCKSLASTACNRAMIISRYTRPRIG